MSDNKKLVHDIRGKLSRLEHLIWCVKSQYDDNMSDDISGPHHRFIQDNMEINARLAEACLAEVLRLLDEIE